MDIIDTAKDYTNLENTSEKYEIIIEIKSAMFRCHGYVSFLRALQTFVQLISKEGSIERLPIMIEDEPSVPYRGIMIDTSRFFLPLDKILKLL